MEAVTREKSGLFPAPAEITFKCSCSDYAGICKHVAAVVYGIGARLDHKPELLFLLRGVDHLELIAEAGAAVAGQVDDGNTGVVFEDISGIFGIDLDDSPAAPTAKAKLKKAKKVVAKKATKKTAITPRKIAKKAAKKAAGKAAKS